MIVNVETKLYGVIGNPVKQSSSPKLFNQIFSNHKINAVYLAFQYQTVAPLIASMKILGIAGYSVTIPFKETVMKYVDVVDGTAEILGCANTIHNAGGKLTAYNFDGLGGIGALTQYCGDTGQDWTKKHIIFLGNGGAARAMLLTLAIHKDFFGKISLVARNQEKSKLLEAEIIKIRSQKNLTKNQPKDFLTLCTWESLTKGADGVGITDNSVIVNTTSLGMSPKDEVSPLPEKISGDKLADFFKPGVIAYDIVYKPLMTKFLLSAEKKGAGIITGENMFLTQAKMQLKVWTGLDLELTELRNYFNKQF